MTTGNIGERSSTFDAETTARLRAVFEEVCARVSRYETSTRAYVASKMLEAATNGEISAEGLRNVGREALVHCPADDATGLSPSHKSSHE